MSKSKDRTGNSGNKADTVEKMKKHIEANKKEYTKNEPPTELESYDDFDRNFFVVRNLHGKCRIGWLEEHINPRTGVKAVTLQYKDKADFYDAYADKKDSMGKPLAPVWFSTTTKRYDTVVYKHPDFVGSNELNLYRGFSVEAKEGDISLYRGFVREIVCGGSEELEEYWHNLAAYGVQNPFLPWGVYVICYSKEEGTGKDTFVDFYGDLFMGYFTTNKSDRVVGRFNSQIAYKPVVKLGEGSVPAKDVATLRGNVTGPKLDIEGKGKQGGEIDNILKFFMTTNVEESVEVSLTDRRTLTLEFSPKRMGDKAYWNNLYNWYYKEGGISSVLWFLQKRELKDFRPYPRPVTKLLRRMQDKSLKAHEQAVLNLLEDGYFPNIYTFGRQRVKLRRMNTTQFREHYQGLYPGLKVISDNKLAELFKAIGATKVKTETGMMWEFPPLVDARWSWEKAKINKREWSDVAEWWDSEDARPAAAVTKRPEPKLVVNNEQTSNGSDRVNNGTEF